MHQNLCVSLDLISSSLGIPLAAVSISKNAAGESKVKMLESVREFDVYIINTGCGEINSA
jgi:ribose-phosphate pyrophosphokinase